MSSFLSTIFRASIWVSLFKWLSVGLGTLSTLILARILLPEDFGLVASAAIVTGLFDIFSKIGTSQYLIRNQALTSDEINTAWTLQFISKIFIALMVFGASYFAPNLLNEPRLEAVLKVLAIIPLLMSMESVGIILLKKEMKFKRVMIFNGLVKIASFVATVSLAFWLENYWAFIYGSVFNYVLLVLGGYVVSSFRPVFCLRNTANQLSFSGWTLLKGVTSYINSRIDQIFVTKYLGSADLGALSLGQKIKSLPEELFISPFSDVLFPGLSKSLSNPQEFAQRTSKLLFFIFFVTLPIAFLMAFLSEPLVGLLLGDKVKWATVVEILPIVAPLIVSSAMVGKLFDTYTLLGKVRFLFFFEAVLAVVSVLVMLWVFESYGTLVSVVIAKVALSYFNMLYLLINLQRTVDIKLSLIVLSILPFALLNYLVLSLIEYWATINWLADLSPIFYILIYSLLFAAIYIPSALLLLHSFKERNSMYHYLVYFSKEVIKKIIN